MNQARNNGVYGSMANSNEPEDIDLISNLPDGVIGHILSCLSTKDAVRTSVLSRNWEYKWTNIYNISMRFCREDNPSSFMSFLDRVLLLTGRSRIMEFYLDNHDRNFPYSNQLNTRIQELILARNVRSLTIFAPSVHSQRIELAPDCFYDSSSITNLDIWIPGVLKVPGAINCFSNLKFLYLHGGFDSPFEIQNVQFPSTDRISLTFPVLETLFLKCKWTNAKYVEICAPELIDNTFVSDDSCSGLYKIKINCGSKLTTLGLSGNYFPDFVLTGHPTHLELRNYDIEDHAVYVSKAHRLLKRFPKLNILRLTGQVVEALVQSSKSGLGFPALCQLKTLGLCFDRRWPTNKDTLELLQLLPSLESLCIYIIGRNCDQEQDHVGTTAKTYTLPYLKEVEFVMFHGDHCEVGLAELILKNAKNVKMMAVKVEDQVSETMIRQKLSKLIPETSRCELVVSTHK